jgi:hypothetical protein
MRVNVGLTMMRKSRSKLRRLSRGEPKAARRVFSQPYDIVAADFDRVTGLISQGFCSYVIVCSLDTCLL